MAWNLDARVPVVIVTDAGLAAALASPGTKVAVLAAFPAPPVMKAGAAALVSFDPYLAHATACGCCAGRPPAATALDGLFQARVRGACAWFERVVALADAEDVRDAITAALRDDAVTAARFRLAAPGQP